MAQKGIFENRIFSDIKSSDDFSASRAFKGKHRIPFKFKHGSSSKAKGGFFDETILTTTDHIEVIKLGTSHSYVGVRDDKFRSMSLNFISRSMKSTNSFNQASASFARLLGNAVPSGSFITIVGSDEDTGPITASYNLSVVSDIANSNGFKDITINNTSDFNTAATWSFAPGGDLGEIHQSSSIDSWSHRFFHSGSAGTSSFALSGSEIGSIRGIGILQFINGVNSTDGTYVKYLVKGKIFGDGEQDSGETGANDFTLTDNPIFLPTREIIIHSSSVVIRSGSFKFNSSSKSAASSSGVVTTLFYQSGSNGPSGSFTGSNANTGSHVFLNAALTTPASSGFYAIPGNENNVLHAFRGGTTSDVTGSAVGSGGEFQVPTFSSKSILS